MNSINIDRNKFTSYIQFDKNQYGNWELNGNYYISEKSVCEYGKFLLEEILGNRFKEIIVEPVPIENRGLFLISLNFIDKSEEAYFLMHMASGIEI